MAAIVLFCLALLVCIVLGTNILYALLAGLVIFTLYGKKQGFSWKELGKMICSGVKTSASVLLVFPLIGILTAFWRACGTLPFIICCAVDLIRPEILLLMTFLLNCGVSMLTGTAFGTAATMGTICVSVGISMGMDPVLLGGAMLSGVYFGDRCSPVSTSALLVSELTETNIYDNIKRMLDKGNQSNVSYESNTYEGYGPSGIAVICETLTDNRNRTAANMRHYFDKFGKGMGAQGCVSWSFDRKGVIVISNEDEELDEDTVMMDALDAGAEDMEADGPVFEVTTDPDSFNDVVKALEEKGYTFESAEIEMVPQNYITMTSEDDVRSMTKLLDMLDDNEDVQNVWHNWQQD